MVCAYDTAEESGSSYYCEVERGGPEAVLRHPTRSLLLCWPPLEPDCTAEDNLMALECVRNLRSGGADNTLLYVGEWSGAAGCVSALSERTAACGHMAGAQFQKYVDRHYKLVQTVPVPRWPGFADALYVFRPRASLHRLPTANLARGSCDASADTGLAARRQALTHLADHGLDRPAAVCAAVLHTTLT